jgi:hypothetical protein
MALPTATLPISAIPAISATRSVILSEAKDLIAACHGHEILPFDFASLGYARDRQGRRCAQDD